MRGFLISLLHLSASPTFHTFAAQVFVPRFVPRLVTRQERSTPSTRRLQAIQSTRYKALDKGIVLARRSYQRRFRSRDWIGRACATSSIQSTADLAIGFM